ncbi:MAG: hypothetical protein LBR23_02945 [Spirochaetaceae bacterium]|jgi:hypothetical protein|nr:hypothetical protein [Spirochaetaceae bacterium]
MKVVLALLLFIQIPCVVFAAGGMDGLGRDPEDIKPLPVLVNSQSTDIEHIRKVLDIVKNSKNPFGDLYETLRLICINENVLMSPGIPMFFKNRSYTYEQRKVDEINRYVKNNPDRVLVLHSAIFSLLFMKKEDEGGTVPR